MADIAEIDDPEEVAAAALERVRDYDVSTLVREKELGAKYALTGVVAPAKRIQSLFSQIQPPQLEFFAGEQTDLVKRQANAFYNLLEQCAEFDPEESEHSGTEAKRLLIEKVENAYQGYFNSLHPLISHATARSQDFARLEDEARAASQAAKDEADNLIAAIRSQKEDTDTILSEVRAAAAEQGVSKQAIHFKTEADSHKESAKKWRDRTIGAGVVVAVYSIASLYLTKLPGLDPSSQYETIQIAVSKVLVFVVLAYLMTLSAKNYLSHRHNEVVNRHRQNALATFTALAEATSDAASADIVLSHAASCIFSPQETGYTKQDAKPVDTVPSLQFVPRIGGAATS